ncbi:phosphotransferase family protein [Tsuneonella sp. CC-YZS046]|uniref:phosphotransferase family protein n=1 Tax=Tsuneonella sp. CC-YZS046 TaxID=3042152 RepID=UPI002D787906|nr:phosphotransferase family protein [Tsuneonella sp. CC-YZS046]WRO65560.1 phosphotransferase family protein [Tsuneonella sp. CC-YZS046]
MLERTSVHSVDRDAIEPRLREILVEKHERRKLGAYRPRTAAEIAQGASALFARSKLDATASNVRRMGGGASKEQFLIDLEGPQFPPGSKCVLRMDPREGILETCRRREAQVIRAVADVVPAPPVLCVDADGEALGQPLLVTGFVGGVTKPTSNESGPSGLGANLGPRIGGALAPQFIDYLAAIHDVDYEKVGLDDYAKPRPGTTDAALWQVNYWRYVREVDGTDTSVLLTLAENWLYERLPVCPQPVLLQGDYRLGNFLFDEETLRITAILDWELSHIGDFHEDLAYSFEPLFGTRNAEGELIVGTMFTTGELLEKYQAASGRTVDPDVLYWYRVLTSYKLIVMNHTSSVLAARDGTNHQNALLAYLASVTAGLSETLCRLLEGDLG